MDILHMWHIFDGKWHHICQVRNGNKTSYYTDGVLVFEQEIQGGSV